MRAFQWLFQDRNEWPDWAADNEQIEEIGASLIGTAVVRLRVCVRGKWVRAYERDWIVEGFDQIHIVHPEVYLAMQQRPAKSLGPELAAHLRMMASEQVHSVAGPGVSFVGWILRSDPDFRGLEFLTKIETALGGDRSPRSSGS